MNHSTANATAPLSRQERGKSESLSIRFHEIATEHLPEVLGRGVILLLAGPAAGKGTNAKILSEHWNVPTLSIGALLRERADVGDSVGRSLKRIMKRGGLVQNEIVFELLEKKLDSMGNPKSFLLDGCPRSMSQLEPLHRIFSERGIANIGALYLKTRLSTALSRSENRRNEDIAKGEKPRNDDMPETVRSRYADFKRDTVPVSKVYAKRGVLAEARVDSDSRETNFEAVAVALGPVVRSWSVGKLAEHTLPDRREFFDAL